MADIISVEEFDDKIAEELAVYTGHLLQRKYKGYCWGVRVLQNKPPMVGICLAELLQFGDANVMVINPVDVSCRDEFDKIVIRLGGELLERASLSRNGSQGVQVTKRPDGFHKKFDKTQKERTVVLKDQFGNPIR